MNLFYQEEFHGFTDLDVTAASEKAEVLRKEGDLLKHDLAEARAHKVCTLKPFHGEEIFFQFEFSQLGKDLPFITSIAQSCIFQFFRLKYKKRWSVHFVLHCVA